jgi:hypothetical protein
VAGARPEATRFSINQTVGQSHPALAPDRGAAFGLDGNGEERLVVVHEISRRLPKTSSGKVMRRACRVAFVAEALDRAVLGRAAHGHRIGQTSRPTDRLR